MVWIAVQGRPRDRRPVSPALRHGERAARPRHWRAVSASRIVHHSAGTHGRSGLVPLRHQLSLGGPGGLGPRDRARASDHVRDSRLRSDRRNGRVAHRSLAGLGRTLAPDVAVRTGRGLSHDPAATRSGRSLLTGGKTMIRTLLAAQAFASVAGLAGSVAAQGPKPAIVLVHGAFADGSSWARLIPILERDGYYVIAVQNPLT